MAIIIGAAPGTSGGGGISGGNDGVSAVGANIKLGHAAAGSGASDFTANRYSYLSTFNWQIGGNFSNTILNVLGNTGQIGINSSAPNSSASFQIDSTIRGFAGPRMTTVQKNAIASPIAGLELYDTTTNKKNYYNGTAWVELEAQTNYTASEGISKLSSQFQLGGPIQGSLTGATYSNRYINLQTNTFNIGGTANYGTFSLDGNTGILLISDAAVTGFTYFNDTNKAIAAVQTLSLGTTANNYKGFAVINSSAAAAGAQQISPMIRWQGQGWKTNATATSQTVDFKADVLPVQGAVSPTGIWRLGASINAAAYNESLFTVDSAGNILSFGSYSLGMNTASTVQNAGTITATGSGTNIGISLVPKGNFGINAAIPDSTTTGGNARGQYAIDLQLSRTAAAQVASGNYSFIIGGNDNTASGSNSGAIGGSNTASASFAFSIGNNNTASGNYSLSLGQRASGYLLGMMAKATGYFAVVGDSQTSWLNSRVSDATMTTGKTTQVTIDGAGTTMLPTGTNRFWAATITWLAVVTNISGTATGVTVGDTIRVTENITLKRVGGTSTILAGPTNVCTHNDGSMATAAMGYSISSGALLPTFTGPTFAGGGTLTIRISMGVKLVEVAY